MLCTAHWGVVVFVHFAEVAAVCLRSKPTLPRQLRHVGDDLCQILTRSGVLTIVNRWLRGMQALFEEVERDVLHMAPDPHAHVSLPELGTR